MKEYSIGTKCVQAGYAAGNGEPRQIPIIQSTTFKYDTSEDMGKLFDLEAEGYFYSRLQNPTCDTVARKIAAMEGGTAAMLTSSGQAANFYAMFNICECGDHIVASSSIYGGSFLGKGNGNGIGSKILKGLSQSNWCDPKEPVYSIGLIVYIVLIIAFAYFYTNITFNPLEIANNMKRSGGFIPGIRPGKPTSDYLNQILNYIVFIGAIGLAFIAFVPIFFNGVFNADVSFGGTSIIIIVGVVIETLKQIESQMRVRYYKGFLDD